MQYDDFTGADSHAFMMMLHNMTRPIKVNDSWFCPVSKSGGVNFLNVDRFDIKNRILYYKLSDKQKPKNIPDQVVVELEFMEMALFCWEQVNLDKSETS